MRYSAKHKLETRARILEAAGRMFRTEGYGGSGIVLNLVALALVVRVDMENRALMRGTRT